MRQDGPEFRREHPLNFPVLITPTGEERIELLEVYPCLCRGRIHSKTCHRRRWSDPAADARYNRMSSSCDVRTPRMGQEQYDAVLIKTVSDLSLGCKTYG